MSLKLLRLAGRYANTAYLVDLQEMQGDNLLRELVRITAQMNWQLNDLKEQIRQGNVISGQQLALTARQYYENNSVALRKQSIRQTHVES
ncbi:hypothetical protein I0P38_23550 [Salmonella enterica subsp. enterica]|uniref:hypothetical protein n=1 Tax=Salmonella enterica TaxID=28901 RepID=UPI00283C818D|nr:hypothetical protein [Salmonella enterica]MDR4119659.1 hypothetical protein [Salmonella enterica subsp. enterica]